MPRTLGRSAAFALFVALFTVSSPAALRAQAAVVAHPDLPIPSSDPRAPVVEVDFVIDPVNPDRMAAAAIVVDSAESVWIGSHIDVFRTTDAGETWTQHRLDMLGGADPWLTVDPDGRLFLAYLAQRAESGPVELLYHTSDDFGATWSPPSSLGRGHDRETMTSARLSGRAMTFLASSLSRSTADSTGLAYAYLARSVDGGPLDSVATVLPNNLQSNTLTTVVTRRGTLIVSLIDYASSSYQMLNSRRAWVLASEDAGQTFAAPRFVAEDHAPRTYFVVAADPTDRFAESRLYSVRTVLRPDSTPALLLSRSDSEGRSWSGDVVVAGDEADEWPVGPAHLQVDRDGIVGVAWWDARHGEDPAAVDLYVRLSLDGGNTFLAAARVTRVTSRNATDGNGAVARRFPRGGDYFGFEPHPSGGFQLIWADSRTGVYQLYTARVEIR